MTDAGLRGASAKWARTGSGESTACTTMLTSSCGILSPANRRAISGGSSAAAVPATRQTRSNATILMGEDSARRRAAEPAVPSIHARQRVDETAYARREVGRVVAEEHVARLLDDLEPRARNALCQHLRVRDGYERVVVAIDHERLVPD